jgi:hypothetical protein
MKFTKLTDAEQAELMELIRDSLDPELYTEDDLPMLRANSKKFEGGTAARRRVPSPGVLQRKVGARRLVVRLFTLGMNKCSLLKPEFGTLPYHSSSVPELSNPFRRAEFWRFRQAGSICQTDRIAIIAAKSSSELRRANARVAGERRIPSQFF